MKCSKHAAEAVAVCAYCGRALCEQCLPSPAPARLVCSPACAAGLTQTDQALQLILQRSVQSARASAFYCYISAALSAAAAVAAWFWLPSPFLIYFTGGCALVLALAGFWHSRGS